MPIESVSSLAPKKNPKRKEEGADETVSLGRRELIWKILPIPIHDGELGDSRKSSTFFASAHT